MEEAEMLASEKVSQDNNITGTSCLHILDMLVDTVHQPCSINNICRYIHHINLRMFLAIYMDACEVW